MLWHVRALLEDRPGALAALAAGCGDRAVNILGLQIFPAPDGRVVDELVLHTTGGWSAEDVARLCAAAGVDATVVPGSPQALEDQPVRYLRAAQVVSSRPDLLEDQLCRLLDAVPAPDPAAPGALVLDDASGPAVALSREARFSDTEMARAAELRRVAAAALGLSPGLMPEPHVPEPTRPASSEPRPAESAGPVLRAGSAADAPALVAMHGRSSSETVLRRYHAPMPRISPRLARSVLEPEGGASMLVTIGDEVVAAGMFARDTAEDDRGTAELGLMVEDRWQRHGLGTRLLRALAIEAAGRGIETLTCNVQPDNEAVMPTIRRSGLRVRARYVDGLTQYRIPVAKLAPRDDVPRRRGNRPAMGEVTPGLVVLLHNRHELRELHPAADLIDQAVRGGA